LTIGLSSIILEIVYLITHINQDQPQVVMSKGFAIMICADPWSDGSAKLEWP